MNFNVVIGNIRIDVGGLNVPIDWTLYGAGADGEDIAFSQDLFVATDYTDLNDLWTAVRQEALRHQLRYQPIRWDGTTGNTGDYATIASAIVGFRTPLDYPHNYWDGLELEFSATEVQPEQAAFVLTTFTPKVYTHAFYRPAAASLSFSLETPGVELPVTYSPAPASLVFRGLGPDSVGASVLGSRAVVLLGVSPRPSIGAITFAMGTPTVSVT